MRDAYVATLDEDHHATCSTDVTAGRGHGVFCNSLIIRYHFKQGVETQPFFGHVSTPCFINH